MFARLKSLQKNITTAGTELQLTTTKTNAYGVKIKAKIGNTGNMYVGHDNTVSATTGFELDAGEMVDVAALLGVDKDTPIDLSQIWLDSSVNGEGVCVVYFELYNP